MSPTPTPEPLNASDLASYRYWASIGDLTAPESIARVFATVDALAAENERLSGLLSAILEPYAKYKAITDHYREIGVYSDTYWPHYKATEAALDEALTSRPTAAKETET